jgi:hypothetical protein
MNRRNFLKTLVAVGASAAVKVAFPVPMIGASGAIPYVEGTFQPFKFHGPNTLRLKDNATQLLRIVHRNIIQREIESARVVAEFFGRPENGGYSLDVDGVIAEMDL